MTLALAFVWSFVAAPTAVAAENVRQDILAHQPKPLPHPKSLGSRPYTVPRPPSWLASLFSARPKSSTASLRFTPVRSLPTPLTELSEVGVWGGTSSPSQIDAWKQELARHPVAERAAVLHLRLGEWQMGRNEQPATAIKHFRAARHLTGLIDRIHGLAAYDTAIALFREGAYQQDAEVFYGSEGEAVSVTGSTEPVYYTYDALYRLSTLSDGSGHAASPVKSTSSFTTRRAILAKSPIPERRRLRRLRP